MNSIIKAISHYLPRNRLTNVDLNLEYPDWPVQKIQSKTGISERPISSDDEYSLELAEKALEQFFIEHPVNKTDIDFIIVCTQTPKYLISTTACLLQHKIGLPTECGALDITLGCSGYVYSLAVADGLIKSGQAKNILLVTTDTYTKLIAKDNRQLRTLFADGATVSLIQRSSDDAGVRSCLFGTDGSGAEKLISQSGGLKGLLENTNAYQADLTMNSVEICNFVLGRVPKLVHSLLAKANNTLDDIDLFVFHQANSYILEHLKQKIGIPPEKFYFHIENVGNTVSSTIPLALGNAIKEGRVKKGDKVMLVGFGVGFSWSGAIVDW